MYKYIILYIIILFQLNIGQGIYPGLTIFTPHTEGGSIENERTYETFLIDENNNIFHIWNHIQGPASMPYLLPDSTILYPYKVQNPTMISGGVGGGIQHIDWYGNILWDFLISNETYQHHHDIEPLPNGNVLILVWERKTDEETYLAGRDTLDTIIECWSEAILEYNSDIDSIVWEWHLWNHLIQDYNPNLSNFGNIFDHPELFDINRGNIGTANPNEGEINGDWMHFNSIDYNYQLDQILVSSRRQNEIFIIDHSTTTEESSNHSGGIYNKGGDFLYRWGNPQNYERGNPNDQKLHSQHDANWVEPGYPGENNIILFNNLYSNNSSMIFEINPPCDINGNYIINDNIAYGPSNPEWTYSEVFFSEIQSGAHRLANGNTLITDATSSRIIEVNTNNQIVWNYIHQGSNLIPRAKKYGYNYLNIVSTGDFNSDNEINIFDIILLINTILDNQSQNNEFDLNQDNNIDIMDIVILINLILQ